MPTLAVFHLYRGIIGVSK